MTIERDRLFMERALLVAEAGRGRTTPNPNVGAVVVAEDGVVVGQGAHLRAGGAHAEVIALERAGARAARATLYCTLEPCSHTGRTGPCTERIVAAGIRRVVAGVADPNPLVSGRGFEFLRAHHVEVERGVMEDAAARLHAPFMTWVTERRPFVIAKMAMSADGFVGDRTRRVPITGPAADRFFHRQRAEVDAIAVGAGTMLADDPQLTPRGAYRERPLTRVIFDWRGRVPAGARVFSTLDAGPVIMVTTAEAARSDPARLASLAGRGVHVETFDERSLRAVLAWLAAREIVTLLVEGGPSLDAAFASDGLIDRVQLVTSPRALGQGVPAIMVPVRGPGRPLGDDVLVEFDVYRSRRSRRPH